MNWPLKRPLEEEEEEEDDDDEEEEEEEPEGGYCSSIQCFFTGSSLFALSSTFADNSELLKLFSNIITSLKKDDFSDADAEGFSEMVNRVLENKFFLEELYKESEDDVFFLVSIRLHGVQTQRRVETTKARVNFIRDDKHFIEATKGGESDMIIRGCVSILLAYCISEDDLKKMGRRIGKVPPEIWGTIQYEHND